MSADVSKKKKKEYVQMALSKQDFSLHLKDLVFIANSSAGNVELR